MINLNRNDFPVLEHSIYLDHAAFSPLARRSVEAGKRYLKDLSEIQKDGYSQFLEWLKIRSHVKTMLADMLHCDADEIALTKNTSDGLLIIANSIPWAEGDNIILFSNEFPANVFPWTSLESRGVEIRFVPEKDGRFQVKDIEALIDGRTVLLAVSFVEFSTGFKNDLKAIGELCCDHEILYTVDAIQGMGALPIDVEECQIDFLSAGGHKWLMSGMGIGCFYAKRSSMGRLSRHLYGHGGVENPGDFLNYDKEPKKTAERFEEGMFNVSGLYVMEASLSLLMETGIQKIQDHLVVLTDHLINRVTQKGYQLLSPREKKGRSGIVAFYSEHHPSEELQKMLMQHRIIVSNRRDCIRVSPHFYNTKDHIDQLIELLPEG